MMVERQDLALSFVYYRVLVRDDIEQPWLGFVRESGAAQKLAGVERDAGRSCQTIRHIVADGQIVVVRTRAISKPRRRSVQDAADDILHDIA